MKTVREWFEELPEPYRSQALANTKCPNTLNRKEPSLEKAISNAFPWIESPEGFEYWRYIRYKATNGGPQSDLAQLVREYFEAKDSMPQADLDNAEKALRKAVGLE